MIHQRIEEISPTPELCRVRGLIDVSYISLGFFQPARAAAGAGRGRDLRATRQPGRRLALAQRRVVYLAVAPKSNADLYRLQGRAHLRGARRPTRGAVAPAQCAHGADAPARPWPWLPLCAHDEPDAFAARARRYFPDGMAEPRFTSRCRAGWSAHQQLAEASAGATRRRARQQRRACRRSAGRIKSSNALRVACDRRSGFPRMGAGISG